MSGCWLLKTEPSTYSFAELERERQTAWTGVRNAAALIHLRAMREGDAALIYHSGAERAVVGLARVARGPYPDPGAPHPKFVAVDLEAVRAFPTPVSLAGIKADPIFADLGLVKISRLSVMPVSRAQWKRLLAMGAR